MRFSFCILLLVFTYFPQFCIAHIFSKRKVIITDLQINNCGSTFDPVRFIDVSVRTTEDGDLEFSGKFDAYQRIIAPITARVKMQRRVLGLWAAVPFCYRKFGSCTFQDVCHFGRPEPQCPPILGEHDVPCECPIEPGRYILPVAQFSVNGTRWAWLLSGDYRGSVRLSRGDQEIACYNATFRLD